MQQAFFSRLQDFIDLRHPLAILFYQVNWLKLYANLAPIIARKPSLQKIVSTEGLFGLSEFAPKHNPRNAGRPTIPLQTMLALCYLKSTYGLSDSETINRWMQDVYFQFFSGLEFFHINKPCDEAQLSRFRKNIGEEGMEILMQATIETAVNIGAIDPSAFEEVIVDTTVQEKAIAYPTDARLLEVARHHLVKAAKQEGITLKQTFAKEGKAAKFKAARHAHAKQFQQMQAKIKRQRTILGILLREIDRKKADKPSAKLQETMDKAKRIKEQKRNDHNKLYAFHAPEVECIGKGKVRQPYEFGVKVGVVTPLHHSLIIGARSFIGNPYDAHVLKDQMEQTTILLQDINVAPKRIYADLGFRGQDAALAPIEVVHRGKSKRVKPEVFKWLKRRQAIEPVIGHLKADHGMKRNWLKGATGDALHALSCAIGFNMAWLLRAILRLGIFLLQILGQLLKTLESFYKEVQQKKALYLGLTLKSNIKS